MQTHVHAALDLHKSFSSIVQGLSRPIGQLTVHWRKPGGWFNFGGEPGGAPPKLLIYAEEKPGKPKDIQVRHGERLRQSEDCSRVPRPDGGGLLKTRAGEPGDVDRMQTQEFGCSLCWPADARAVWEARGGLTRLKELIDESHFIVAILVCSRCDQRYVSIFTELIDWADGEDPQYWTLMPITEAEAEGLIQQETSLNEESLNALGPGRRCIRRDHPKTGPPQVFWGRGVLVGPHD